tara:strand:+ start:7457 stop:9868 length:2412 start_codon:yes stop_codon:yes gene_type:complete
MAEEIIFKVSTDTGNSVKAVSDVEKSLKDAKGATDSLNKSNVDAAGSIKKTEQALTNEARQATEAKKAITELNTETAKGAAQSTTLAGRLEAMNKTVAETPINIRAMNKQIQEYQAIALEAGRTSPIGQEALKNAAALKDRYTDIQNETKRLADDQKNLKGAMDIGSGVVAGYGAVKSAMALTGIESESLQKSMVKLQAAQTLLTSLDRIRTLVQKESSAMILLSSIRTGILTGAQTVYTAATVGTTVAMKALNVAMLAMPVIAIIAAIVALVAIIYNMVSATEVAEEMNNKLTASVDKYQRALDRLSSKQLRDIDNKIKQAQAEGASAEKLHGLELERMAKEEETRKVQTLLFKSELDQRKIAYRQALKEGNSELATTIKEEVKTVKEKYQDIRALDGQYAVDKKAEETKFAAEQLAETKAIQDKRNADWKAAQDKRKAEEEKIAKEKLERERLLSDLMVSNIEDQTLRERTALLIAQERDRQDLVTKFGDDTALMAELKLQQASEIAKSDAEIAATKKANDKLITDQEILDKAAIDEAIRVDKKAGLELDLLLMAEDFEARMEVQRELNALELEEKLLNEDLTENEIALIKEKYRIQEEALDEEQAEKKKQLAKDVAAATQQTAEQGLAAITNISDILFEDQLNKAEKGSSAELAIKKKQFEVNKKLQIAQAIMQGVQAVQAAYSSGSAIPIVGAVTGPLFAALAGVGSILNINKIKNTKFDSGGAGAVSAPSVSAPSIPSASSVLGDDTSTTTAGLPGSGTEGQAGAVSSQPSIKVNIVDSEMKASLDKAAKVEALSTIG